MGFMPQQVGERLSFVFAQGPRPVAELARDMMVNILTEAIAHAQSAVWNEAGICPVCKRPLKEHAPGPPCVPRV
jgi:hypothetical protein